MGGYFLINCPLYNFSSATVEMELRFHNRQMLSMCLEGEITGISQHKGFVLFFIFSHDFLAHRSGKAWWLKHDQESLRVSPWVGDCNQLVIKTCARQLGAALTTRWIKLDWNGVSKRRAWDIRKKDMFQTRILWMWYFSFPFQDTSSKLVATTPSRGQSLWCGI